MYTRIFAEMVYFRYFIWILHGNGTYFFMESNHLWGTWINLLTRLQFDVIKITSMNSSYSLVSFLMVLNLLINISLAVLVHSLDLPIKVSNTQWYTHKKSVHMCNFLTLYWCAKLMPYSTGQALPELYVQLHSLATASTHPRLQLRFFPIRSRLPRN